MTTTSAFKRKPDKIKYLTKITTLDEKHQSYINNFDKQKKSLPEKKQQLLNLNKLLENCDTTDIDQRAKLRNDIEELEELITDIESGKNELKYYIQTQDILNEYYSQIDDPPTRSLQNESLVSDKLIELNEASQQLRKPKKITKKRANNVPKLNSINVLSFFKVEKEPKPVQDTENTEIDTDKSTNSEDNLVKEITITNKATLYDNYCKILTDNNKCVRKQIITKCNTCNKEKLLIHADGLFVCTICGETEDVIIESDIPNHKENMNEKPRYPYKRLNHLIEILNQFQAKESTEIPNQVFQDILNEVNRMRKFTEIQTAKYIVSKKTMKHILKKLHLEKYYEHIFFIITKLTGRPAPMLPRTVEEKIKHMFRQMEELFPKYCPKGRINFLNYNYLLNKIFVILGFTEFAECFSLLKAQDKLKLQDSVFKNICVELGWKFIPSI